MKQKLMILFAAGVLAAGAAGQEGKGAKGAAKPAAKAKPQPQALTPPPDAERIGEAMWRAKDAEGKVWIYRRTPFGMTRYEEEGGAAQGSRAAAAIRVVEAGEKSVVFERRTPFGASRWTKSADELNGEEKQALEAWRKAPKQ